MKRSLFIISLCLSLGMLGCSSIFAPPDHSIRIKNDFSQNILNTKIGDVAYGIVSSGTTTAYLSVDDGTHNIWGTTPNNLTLTGTVTVIGNGTHKWTMTILASGSVTLAEDK